MQNMQGILKPRHAHQHERTATPQTTSSNPSSGSTPKPKRPKYSTSTGKKRFAPKTRTGCLTCRARRVKCTEERPTCMRCVKGDYTCKYATDQTKYFPSKEFQTNLKSWTESSNESSDDSTDNKLASPLQPIYGTAEETYYLNRFLSIAAPWFSSYIDSAFFFKLLPQRSWHHPALKHSLVALTMASESARLPFTPSEFAFSNEKHQARHHWHYAQALQEIYKACDINEDVVLLSSAIFWLHDNITKNSKTAMVHLQGFLRILTERKIRKQKLSWKDDEWEATILRGLVFSADVADEAFAETLEPNLMKNIRSRLNDPRYSRSFKKFSAVRDELRLGLTAIPYSALSGTPDSPSSNSAVTAAELRTYFERWYRAFSSFADIGDIDKVLLECHYVCVALSLQVHESGQKSPKVNDPQSVHRMEYILSMLETIDFKQMVQPPLGKDVEMPVIPILTQVIVLATGTKIRAKAFQMLRQLNRVEGLWASDVVADMMSIAYPTEGGVGPWSKTQPIKSKVRTSSESDNVAVATRDNHTHRVQRLDGDFPNGEIELNEAYGQARLNAPLNTTAKRQEQSMLQTYIADLEASLAADTGWNFIDGQNMAVHDTFTNMPDVGQPQTNPTMYTSDSPYWMLNDQPAYSINTEPGTGPLKQCAELTSNVDQAMFDAIAVSNFAPTEDIGNHRAEQGDNSNVPNATLRAIQISGKSSKVSSVAKKANISVAQDADNDQAKSRKGGTTTRRFRLGGDYSYVNHIGNGVAFELPATVNDKISQQTSQKDRQRCKTNTSPQTMSSPKDIQSAEQPEANVDDMAISQLNFNSGDEEERELSYGMGGPGFNLHVR